jgi:hypothetical protein
VNNLISGTIRLALKNRSEIGLPPLGGYTRQRPSRQQQQFTCRLPSILRDPGKRMNGAKSGSIRAHAKDQLITSPTRSR